MPDLPHILLIMMLAVMVLTELGWLPIWFQDRRHRAVFWSMIAAAVFTFSMICRVTLPFLPAIAIANSGLLIGHGLIWTACRSLRKLPPMSVWIMAPAMIWLGLCFEPAFQANVNLRIFVFGMFAVCLNGLAVREVWLIKRGSIVIRGWVLGILSIQATLKLVWAAWTLAQPVSQGLTFSSIPGVVPTLTGVIGFILLLGPAIVALDKEQSDLRQQDIARNDFTTGVGNRRYFEEALNRHFNQAAKRGYSLSLIMVDVDQFKDYNDLYGHPAGDRCLQALAEALKFCCRQSDVVGRYGGEEFAILLPDTDTKMALAVAKRMLAKVRDLRLKHALRPDSITTISLGVASVKAGIDKTTPDELVEMADRALYRAKHEGRDRVCLACDEDEVVVPFRRTVE